MYDIERMPQWVDIGYTGETQYRTVEIDMSAWLQTMPNGVPSIVHIRPGESEADAYIASTSFSDGILSWTISASDLGDNEGTGLAQVWLEENENFTLSKVGMSAVFATLVRQSLSDGSSDIPPAQLPWLQQMTSIKTDTIIAMNRTLAAYESVPESIYTAIEKAAEATESAQNASASANSASGSAGEASASAESASASATAAGSFADNAETQALKAEGYAVGTQEGIPVASGSDYYENNTEYFAGLAGTAKIAAQAAQGKAETAQGKAEDAQTAAESAQGLAEAAQTAAESAQTAAETAQGKAEDAQEAAEIAQGKAEDAQDAAEIAQGKAEDAQEAAEIAQGKAEDAQEAAEAAIIHTPYIDDTTGDWMVWSNTASQYVDTGVCAQGDSGTTVSESTKTGVELDIADEDGYVAIRVKDGEIETENFQSSLVSKTMASDATQSDFDISDASGYVIFRIKDGNIITPEFNSGNAILSTNIDTVLSNKYLGNRLTGVKWDAMGDSLTDPSTVGASHKNYTRWISEKNGMSLNNVGVGGKGYWQGIEDEVANVRENTDIVTIFGSLNDITNYITSPGTPTDTWAAGDRTYCARARRVFDALLALKNDIRIGVILPTPWVNYNPYDTAAATQENVENMLASLTGICKIYGIPVLDLYHGSNLRPWDNDFKTAYYVAADGYHPNELGNKLFIAPQVEQFLISLACMY